MPLDPREEVRRSGQSTEEKLRAQVRDLERAVAELKRTPRTMVGDGAPAVSAGNLREGTQYIDRTNLFVYWVVNGAWKRTAALV